ncbi:hypothetical protein [Streptomyces xanthophaeus]|uniref:hypothetical protein n=1 Tax=Streptomyces xanthophaeus TaxID=67385 RepID=UPI0026495EF1|nr:hypothetical protein [Streptomyces xanthophaeus]WKD36618.1 hypothetical protein KO717_34910 [Streptomyces xanthophaeus]
MANMLGAVAAPRIAGRIGATAPLTAGLLAVDGVPRQDAGPAGGLARAPAP